MAWSGFSEAQIRQMKEETGVESTASSRTPHPTRGVGRRGRPTGGRSRGPPPTRNTEKHNNTLPPEQRLAQPRHHESDIHRKQPQDEVPAKPCPPEGESKDSSDEAEDSPLVTKEVEANILDDNEGKQRELTKLQQLQEQQKIMEAENKKKKALLFQALENRKKKTQEEAMRLAFVQKELLKIESLLTNDVCILRDKIEESSRLYAEAEKRYQHAEKEFVAAKINLHKMEEKKEALTEHLFTIIHQNEQRKAKKLEELVSSLDADDMDLLSDNLPGARRESQGRQGETPENDSGRREIPNLLQMGKDGRKLSEGVDPEAEVVGERSPADGASPSEIDMEAKLEKSGGTMVLGEPEVANDLLKPSGKWTTKDVEEQINSRNPEVGSDKMTASQS